MCLLKIIFLFFCGAAAQRGLDIRRINYIRLISKPIHAPSHELEETDTNIPPTKVISKRIFVELLSIREETVILCLWGMNPLAYFSLLFYVEVY